MPRPIPPFHRNIINCPDLNLLVETRSFWRTNMQSIFNGVAVKLQLLWKIKNMFSSLWVISLP